MHTWYFKRHTNYDKRCVEMSFHVYRERTRVDRVEGKHYKRYSPFTYFKVKYIFLPPLKGFICIIYITL